MRASGGLHRLGARILGCESGGGAEGEPDWTAENPHSTASGGAQYLDSTWNGYRGYGRAVDAPQAVQEERFWSDLEAGGPGPWEASRHCWG